MKKNKQIFLIGLSIYNFLNCSIDAIRSINKSQCVVISNKFSKHHINNVRKLCKILYFEEELIDNKANNLWKKIISLTAKFDVISHIKINDPIFLSDGIEELLFFEKFKITTKIISGTIEIIELLNKSQNPLTNRSKNSSVTFLNETTNFSIEKTLSVLKTDKLIINLLKSYDITRIISELKKQNKFKKIFFINNYIFEDISKRIDNLQKLIKFEKEKTLKNYLIVAKK